MKKATNLIACCCALMCVCYAQTGPTVTPVFAGNSMLDLPKSFTVVREHLYTFTNPPSAGQALKATVAGAAGTANPPLGPNPQLQFGNIFPCAGVISALNNFAITGIETTYEKVPSTTRPVTFSPGFAMLTRVRLTQTAGAIRRYESLGGQTEVKYHDAIGIRMAPSSFYLDHEMIGAAGVVASGGSSVTVPVTYRVVTVINGYCADELLAPPTNP